MGPTNKTGKEANTLSGSVISAQSSGKKKNWKCDSQRFFEGKFASNSKCVVCFKNYFAGKGG